MDIITYPHLHPDGGLHNLLVEEALLAVHRTITDSGSGLLLIWFQTITGTNDN